MRKREEKNGGKAFAVGVRIFFYSQRFTVLGATRTNMFGSGRCGTHGRARSKKKRWQRSRGELQIITLPRRSQTFLRGGAHEYVTPQQRTRIGIRGKKKKKGCRPTERVKEAESHPYIDGYVNEWEKHRVQSVGEWGGPK